MTDDQAVLVEVDSLEDFLADLDILLGRAQTAEESLASGDLSDTAMPLGTFTEGESTTDWYVQAHALHVGSVRRLINAIEAARGATSAIVSEYRTTEERNAASAADIGATFDDQGGSL